MRADGVSCRAGIMKYPRRRMRRLPQAAPDHHWRPARKEWVPRCPDHSARTLSRQRTGAENGRKPEKGQTRIVADNATSHNGKHLKLKDPFAAKPFFIRVGLAAPPDSETFNVQLSTFNFPRAFTKPAFPDQSSAAISN